MILALNQLRNLGWVALVFLVAILLYPLSLGVAALRSDLKQTEAQIVSVKRQLRYLETEFAARSSMQQLELWNDLEYGYVAPNAKQFLAGEQTLAHLGDRGEASRLAMADVDVPAPGGNDVLAVAKPSGQAADADGAAQESGFATDVVIKEKTGSAKSDDGVAAKRAQLAAGLDQRLSRDARTASAEDGE
jgi:hypothetical protein